MIVACGPRQVVCCFGACLMTLYLFALDILLAASGISLHVNSGPGCAVTAIESVIDYYGNFSYYCVILGFAVTMVQLAAVWGAVTFGVEATDSTRMTKLIVAISRGMGITMHRAHPPSPASAPWPRSRSCPSLSF